MTANLHTFAQRAAPVKMCSDKARKAN